MNHAFILQPEFKQPASRADQRSPQDRLTEACGLAQAIDLDIVHHEIITIARPRAATLLGPGVVERIAQNAEELDHPLIIINASLTPVQHRNLERALSCKVIDRTALIL
ncbi:MAG: GTPase HflX, partial [Candidatus Puniceispirillaceae bacterium]